MTRGENEDLLHVADRQVRVHGEDERHQTRDLRRGTGRAAEAAAIERVVRQVRRRRIRGEVVAERAKPVRGEECPRARVAAGRAHEQARAGIAVAGRTAVVPHGRHGDGARVVRVAVVVDVAGGVAIVSAGADHHHTATAASESDGVGNGRLLHEAGAKLRRIGVAPAMILHADRI